MLPFESFNLFMTMQLTQSFTNFFLARGAFVRSDILRGTQENIKKNIIEIIKSRFKLGKVNSNKFLKLVSNLKLLII